MGSASWAGGDCGRRMKNRSGSPEKALKAGKKRKSVSFQEAKDEEDDKDRFKPQKPFVKVLPSNLLSSGDKEKEIVVLQIPEEVDIDKLDGELLFESAGDAGGAPAGCKYAIHLEDKIYADQLHALVPVGKKDLEVAEISHMFTLSKGVRSLKAEPK